MMHPQMVRPPIEPSKKMHGDMGSEISAPQNTKKTGKYQLMIILLVILLIIAWGAWRIFPYFPFIPQHVRLKSAVYLRSPHIYGYDTAGYDPERAPLAPEWIRLNIDRENNLAVFESSIGEQASVTLGEPQWVKGCENQFRVESFPLPDGLTLGSIEFQKPILIVACEMWAAGEKIRPVRLVIKEGPIPEDQPFYFGMECNPKQEICMSFAETLSELVGTVIDVETGQALPAAHITISSGMGTQEYTGSFRVPVYVAMQLEYRVTMQGYVDKIGEILNFYGNKMEIMYFTTSDHTQGRGDIFDLPGYGQEMDYSIELTKK
jgi:hypothetical protein